MTRAWHIHRWIVAVLLAALLVVGPASAAEHAEKFLIDKSHTFVQFSVDRFGFNAVLGQVPDVQGVVTLNAKHLKKSAVTATLNLASVVSGDATRDEHVKGPFWLDVKKFGTITFVSRSVRPTGKNEAEVTGLLTMHGVEAPVTLKVRINKRAKDPAMKKEAIGFSATATLKRSDFGIKTALGMIGDEVTIRIEALAHQSDE